MVIDETRPEYKCLKCEYLTQDRAEMSDHVLQVHQRFFNPDSTKPTLVSQLGHQYWHVKVLNHGGIVMEVVSTKLDPNAEKLPTGNLTDESLFPYGSKHKGERMKDVPYRYLHWIYTQTEQRPFNTGVFTYIRKNMTRLKMENLELKWIPMAKEEKTHAHR